MTAVIIWIIIAALVVIIDITTSNFLFSFFALGAIAAMISEIFNVSVGTQILIFLMVNLITVAIAYPITKKNLKKKVERLPLMEEKYIGLVKEAEENIRDEGRIKLEGIYWRVKNIGDEIKAGEKYKIISIDGIKLIVKKEEEI
ncbi:NfeD family protein [Caproiciproducens sp. MSJ-32]|uniref:NfeD family protein n=1 Tax=Caproiciproducens sp. MSJ-32 TaxID=2841527 RepID=UPI001C0F6C5A|nr:NfeD family protein [Caproiciproducens sp. MSJ-32]